ncbi:unnamed protein product [Rhizophagus irregularis]|nr:unnamed protein product [Rhizophagus irregularis]
MEEGGLKKRKTTKTTPCCPLNKSVFIGGQLNGKSSQEIKDFISTKFSVGTEFTFPDGKKTSFLPSKMAGSNEFTVYKIENESPHGNGSRTILVTLNVGGVLYTTTKGTLLKKTNFLRCLLMEMFLTHWIMMETFSSTKMVNYLSMFSNF